MSTNDTNIASYTELLSPSEMIRAVPTSTSNKISEHVARSRQTIRNIIDGHDPRMMLVIGPCSIHDPVAAIDYAMKLSRLSSRYSDKLFIVMRTYFEKPRTITGWKGLLYDPNMDDSNKIIKGIQTVRSILASINELGLPCACEFLDPNMPQYYADLISWGAIGARTTESQVHRQMASGLSCPVGFKNSTSGSIKYPINSIKSCATPHSFPGINKDGRAAIVTTKGNKYCHLVLRGSDHGPNYKDIDNVSLKLQQSDLSGRRVMVDCSHGNSGKCHLKQMDVWEYMIDHVTETQTQTLIGLMIESNLQEGNCSMEQSKCAEYYGFSVTDKCIGWNDTEKLIKRTYSHLG